MGFFRFFAAAAAATAACDVLSGKCVVSAQERERTSFSVQKRTKYFRGRKKGSNKFFKPNVKKLKKRRSKALCPIIGEWKLLTKTCKPREL